MARKGSGGSVASAKSNSETTPVRGSEKNAPDEASPPKRVGANDGKARDAEKKAKEVSESRTLAPAAAAGEKGERDSPTKSRPLVKPNAMDAEVLKALAKLPLFQRKAATHKVEGSRYAVKVVENITLDDEENLEALETEIKILRQLSHPHIVQLKEVRALTRARAPSPTP